MSKGAYARLSIAGKVSLIVIIIIYIRYADDDTNGLALILLLVLSALVVSALLECIRDARKAKKGRNAGYETNAERIRKMTDEELAYILAGQCTCCAYQPRVSGCASGSCQKGVLEWLKKKKEE